KGTSAGAAVLATPGVRKLAKDLGVDLDVLPGTGPQGRITEEDVRQAAIPSRPLCPDPSFPLALSPHLEFEQRVPFIGIRRRTAEKMAESKRIVAHVTHVDEADMSELVALREKVKFRAGPGDVKPAYLAYIIKATARTLGEFPYLNSTLDEERQEIVLKSYFNIAVAVDTEKGLITPVIKNCETKSVFEIAKELDDLVAKARAGRIVAADLQGGTFTITNVGSIGGLAATPIVNYPEVAILGVMKIIKRPVVREGQIVIRDMMNLCLSFDHRVLDGARAARFTAALIKCLENPGNLS
ncbi:MAG: dihydrolipoamide acetyltransferase family protein, partial [Elusimicrobiota bacterium]